MPIEQRARVAEYLQNFALSHGPHATRNTPPTQPPAVRKTISTRIACLLAALLCLTFSGCVTHREFYGDASNLDGKLASLPAGSHLKMKISGSGAFAGDSRYLVFSLSNPSCIVALAYPQMQPDHMLRADTHSGRITAWLTRNKHADCSWLALGRPPGAEWLPLHGTVEIIWGDSSRFYVNTDLSDDTGLTSLHGSFASYRTVWSPLVGPAMLMFGDDGPGHMSARPILPQD